MSNFGNVQFWYFLHNFIQIFFVNWSVSTSGPILLSFFGSSLNLINFNVPKYFFYRSIRKKKDDLFNYKNLSKKISFEDFINPVNKISFFEKNIFKNEATYQNFIRKFIFDKSDALSFNKIYKIINKI